MTTTALESLHAKATPIPWMINNSGDVKSNNRKVVLTGFALAFLDEWEPKANNELACYAVNNIQRVTRERDAAVSALRTILRKACGEHQCKQEALHALARIKKGSQ